MIDSSERTAAERALEEAQARIATMTENIPGMVFQYVLRADGNHAVTYVSSKCRELFQVEPEAALANVDLLFGRYHPEDFKDVQEAIRISAETLQPYHMESRFVLNGKHYWREVISLPTRMENGDVVWDGVVLDINDRKQTEFALQEEKAKFQRMTENVPGMIYRHVVHPDGTDEVTYISAQSREIFEVEPEAALQDVSVLWDRIHPDDLKRIREDVQDSVDSLTPFASVYRLVLPRKGVRWVQHVSRVERLENGDVVSDGITMDITDRRQAELALLESEVKFHRMTENVPGMISRYVMKADGSNLLLYASPQIRELFEIEPDEAYQDDGKLFARIHPDDLNRIITALQNSADQLLLFNEEYRVMLPKQGLRWHHANSQPSRTDEGDTIFDGVTFDITHRKTSELQLRLANEELARATKMKDEFLANMSHELRTPLSAILGLTEGLQQGIFGPTTEKQDESYRIIQESGSHLLGLINEVLDLAKIESGSVELEITDVEIPALCTSSLQLVAQQAKKKHIELNLNTPFNLPTLQADRKRVRQILVNLLSNAVKFTGEEGQVTLSVKRLEPADDRGTMVRFSVNDTGIGIEASELDALFDPFVQVETALNRSYDGTGLGLALVRQFTELHGGHVGVTSERGGGSCFSVDLPLCQSGTATVVPPRPANAIPGTKALESVDVTEFAFVLLAEDNEQLAAITIDFLEDSNFRVHAVTNGQAAIDAALALNPDVILMDVQMPGVDGLEAITRIRANPDIPNIPIIALTGLAMAGDAKRCLDVGADEYLSKPFRMRELVNTIRRRLSMTSNA